jgi:hypothetical protein
MPASRPGNLSSGNCDESPINTYVSGGGRIIAMSPDPQIKDLFGLDTASGTQTRSSTGATQCRARTLSRNVIFHEIIGMALGELCATG